MEVGASQVKKLLTQLAGGDGPTRAAEVLATLISLHRPGDEQHLDALRADWCAVIDAMEARARRKALQALMQAVLAAHPAETNEAYHEFWRTFLSIKLSKASLKRSFLVCVKACCEATDAVGQPAPRLAPLLPLELLRSVAVHLVELVHRLWPFERLVGLLNAVGTLTPIQRQDSAWRCIADMPSEFRAGAWARWLDMPEGDARLSEVRLALSGFRSEFWQFGLDPTPLMAFLDSPLEGPGVVNQLMRLLKGPLARDVVWRLLHAQQSLASIRVVIETPGAVFLIVSACRGSEKRLCIERVIACIRKLAVMRRVTTKRGSMFGGNSVPFKRRVYILTEMARALADPWDPFVDRVVWQMVIDAMQAGWAIPGLTDALQAPLCTLATICAGSSALAKEVLPLWRNSMQLKIGPELQKAIADIELATDPSRADGGLPAGLWQRFMSPGLVSPADVKLLADALFVNEGGSTASSQRVATLFDVVLKIADNRHDPRRALLECARDKLKRLNEAQQPARLNPAIWTLAMAQPAVFDLLWGQPQLLYAAALQAYLADPRTLLPHGASLMTLDWTAVRASIAVIKGLRSLSGQQRITHAEPLRHHPSALCQIALIDVAGGVLLPRGCDEVATRPWARRRLRRCIELAVERDSPYVQCFAELLDMLCAQAAIANEPKLLALREGARKRGKGLHWRDADEPPQDKIGCRLDCHVVQLETPVSAWVHVLRDVLVELADRVAKKQPLEAISEGIEWQGSLCALLVAFGTCSAPRVPSRRAP